MPTQKRAICQICRQSDSKYTCAQCTLLYCSLPCYKQHKATSCRTHKGEPAQPTGELPQRAHLRSGEADVEDTNAAGSLGTPEATPAHAEPALEPKPDLRPLTSLKWPYAPEESAYPDPLKRDDPKPLQLQQYEAIATSPAIRHTLAAYPQLPALLRSIDQLRGPEREEALERALGVSSGGGSSRAQGWAQTEEDTRALRVLAEAVEDAVRGGKRDVLGLDWGD